MRGFFSLAGIGAFFALCYERVISLEWLAWIWRFEWLMPLLRGGWWLLRGLGHLAMILLALLGSGSGHPELPRLPRIDDAPSFVTHNWANAFLGVLKDHPGNFGPENWTLAHKHYWILVRTTTDETTYVDGNNKSAKQVCQHLYAAAAVEADGQFLKPEPFNIVGGIAWPEAVIRCRVEGGDRTYAFPTLHEKGVLVGENDARLPPG